MAVQILKVGRFAHLSGEVVITRRLLAEMVSNFERDIFAKVFIDLAHNPEDGAAGVVTRLWIDADRLMADVTWTPYGLEAITARGFRYLSAEFSENFFDNERRLPHGAVLLGAALVIRPTSKAQQPIF